jgi:hypothetical protein
MHILYHVQNFKLKIKFAHFQKYCIYFNIYLQIYLNIFFHAHQNILRFLYSFIVRFLLSVVLKIVRAYLWHFMFSLLLNPLPQMSQLCRPENKHTCTICTLLFQIQM